MKDYIILNNSAAISSIIYSELSYANITFDTGYIANNNNIINDRKVKNSGAVTNLDHATSNNHQIRVIDGLFYLKSTRIES